ncbi:MAG: lipid A-modifier LpxR family protein [Pseudomonadota bacterium]
MLISTIGLLGALACEGCSYFIVDDYAAPPKTGQIVLSPTNSMLIAAPTPLGLNVFEPAPEPEIAPYDRIMLVENILTEYGVAVPVRHNAPVRTVQGPSIALVGSEEEPSLTLTSAVRFNALEDTNWSASPVLQVVHGRLNAQRVSGPVYKRDGVNAELAFSAPSEFTGLNVDIGVAPRATIQSEGDFSVRRIGAEFRLGQDIDQRGNPGALPSWYVFAGADGEAVIFNNGAADGLGLGLVNGVQLHDQVTVGDIHAGLSVHRYGTNFSFSYIRREVEYRDNARRFDQNEDFGGITVSWRR